MIVGGDDAPMKFPTTVTAGDDDTCKIHTFRHPNHCLYKRGKSIQSVALRLSDCVLGLAEVPRLYKVL